MSTVSSTMPGEWGPWTELDPAAKPLWQLKLTVTAARAPGVLQLGTGPEDGEITIHANVLLPPQGRKTETFTVITDEGARLVGRLRSGSANDVVTVTLEVDTP